LGKVEIESTDKLRTLQLANRSAIASIKNGIYNLIATTNANGTSTGLSNVITGSAFFKYGVVNFIGTNSATTINEVGSENHITPTGTVQLWVHNNFYQPTTANNGNFIGLANAFNSKQLGRVTGCNSGTNVLIYGVNNNIRG
jgi:hypothetical protein